MNPKGKLKDREWIVILLFLGLLLSLIFIARLSDNQTDREIERHLLLRARK